MENFKEIKQEENLSSQPSPKKMYLLIGAITTLVVLIGGVGIFVSLTQREVPFQAQVIEVQESNKITEEATEEKAKMPQVELESTIDVSNWTLYVHETLGFSIKLPLEFEKFEETITGFSFHVKGDPFGFDAILDISIIPSSVMDELSEEQVEAIEWMKQGEIGDSFNGDTIVSNIDIDGCSAVQIQRAYSSVDEVNSVCFAEDSIFNSSLSGKAQKYRTIYNTSLSTFRFNK